MRRLVINHAQGRMPAPGTIILGLGLLLTLIVLAGLYHQLATENASLQNRLEAKRLLATPQVSHPAKNIAAVSPALTAEISEAQSHIHTPWVSLLHDLEQVHQSNLYWMQLAPDVKRKHIRMTVLAQHRQQGWALVERLKHQSGLTDVKLKSSEATDVNGVPMMTFHLEAGWKY